MNELPILPLAALRAGDAAVIVLYFALTAAFAVWYGRRNKDTEGYFLGGRDMPGWAVGLSLVGTSISSISFLALPAAAFALDWRLLVPNYAVAIGLVVAVIVFVPLFRALPYTTAYEFLEDRLGRFSRIYCAVTFMSLQLLRLSSVLYLASIAVGVLLGVEVTWIIVIGGLFILAYTVVGGIEVVIWTDVAQTIILWGGALVMFVFIAVDLPDGLAGGLGRAWEAGKFSHGEFDWDMARRTFWTLLVIGAFDAVANNASNQTVVQRYIAARSTREARKAVWVALLASIPTWIVFYLVGTMLWALYTASPDPSLAAMTPEEIVPYFTVNYLPVGVAGLIIAAVMAAAMSSLDSSINAVSTTATTDIVRRYLAKGRDERFYLTVAKTVSAATGAVMIVLALVIHTLERESIVDLMRVIGSVFGGVVGGIFLLAIFVRRVGPRALLVALPFALVPKVWYLVGSNGLLPEWAAIPVHAYWVGVVSNVTLMVLAFALSFVWPRESTGSPADAAPTGFDVLTRADN